MKRSPEGTLNLPYDSHVAPDRKPRFLAPLAVCKGKTPLGEPCRLGARLGSAYCRWHSGQAVRA